MMKTSLQRIITPPPLPPSTLTANGANTASQIVQQALAVQLAKSMPFSSSNANQNNTSDASNSTTDNHSITTTTNSTSARIRLLTVHPSLPFIAYVLVDSDASATTTLQQQVTSTGTGSGGNSKQRLGTSPRTMLVVQDWHTRRVVWTMTLLEICSLLMDQDSPTMTSSLSAEKQLFGVQKLGVPSFLEFYDPATLYYSGMSTERQSQAKHTACHPTNKPNKDITNKADPFISRWQGLIVQFSNQQHITLLNLRRKDGGGHGGKNHSVDSINLLRPILSDLTPERAQGNTPSSNVLPVSGRWWLVATNTGNMLCWDWHLQTVHQTVKPSTATPMSKNDVIVFIAATNSLSDSTLSTATATSTLSTSSSSQRRIVTCTKSHTIFVMDCHIGNDGIQIGHPLIQLTGGVAPLFGPCTSLLEDNSTGWLEPHRSISYDPVEDYLYWNSGSAQSKQTQQQGIKILGWMLQRHLINSTATGKIPSVLPDVSMTLIPPSAISALSDSPLALMASCWHPAFGSKILSCAMVQRSGELQVVAASLPSPEKLQQQQQQMLKQQKSSSGTSSTTSPTVSLSSTRFGTTKLGNLWAEHRDISTNPMAPTAGTQLRVYGIGAPRFLDSSILIIATNAGFLVVEVASCNAGSIHLNSVRGKARHCHFGAMTTPAALQRSVLLVRQSSIVWAQIDFGGGGLATGMATSTTPTAASATSTFTAVKSPMLLGPVFKKSPVVVYESPAALHLPVDIQRRKVRLQPRFLPSPSGNFICVWWPQEMRYEILHIASMLNKSKLHSSISASGTADSTFSTAVASGIQMLSFAWINAEDVFAVLHAGEDQNLIDSTASTSTTGSTSALTNTNTMEDENGAIAADRNVLSKMKSVGGAATGAFGSTMKTVGGATLSLGSSTFKKTTGALKNITQAGVKITKMATTPMAGSTSVPSEQATGTEASDDDSGFLQEKKRTKAWVEIKTLVHVQANASEIGVSVAAATAASMGELTLRGSHGNIPSALFCGPVLCVATREPPGDNPDDIRGLAYFYTRKRGADDPQTARASEYVSSGPALPYPDLVEWDEEGRLCAMVIQSRVAIYLSESPDFVLLGTSHVSSPNDRTATVISVKFVHGVLYATTRSSVHCIFLGDLENGICCLDSFVLASTHVPSLPSKSIATCYNSLMPPMLPMPLYQPVVLGYQSGSLLLSTVTGLMAIPLSHPLLRIGSLLAAGQVERAKRWFDAIPPSDHEGLSNFLERRGFADMALQLPGLSLESLLDMCMRHGFDDKLDELLELNGVKGLRAIDMGQGMSSSVFGAENHGHSIVVSVAGYLLSLGKAEIVRRLATECLGTSSIEGSKEAFVLATMLLPINAADAVRLIQRALDEAKDKSDDAEGSEWLVGHLVQDKLLRN